MIEDKDVVPSQRIYRPVVVLVSDGAPNNGWERPLNEFISNGRSAKCDRIAMAIGADADEAVLGKFFEGTEHPLLYAENAKQLKEAFKYVTMSVTMRAKSQTQNVAPAPSTIDAAPATIEARQEKMKSLTQKASTEDGGYW